ncbi:hypothetical protein ACQR5V_18710 [Xanthomonas oryzae pv. oryzicola]|nr:hypothetical protein [Xanthomonas oryzae]MEC5115723.1 hypothetical protein [Xanthomonas oryzae pv. oryzicola]QEO97300.1 hypothetical protein XOCgx_2310 [Xanthomonas oryzae pv. oryzicola]QGH66014.1 hypothetical protein GHV42_10275 [Xanthomonas oryzae pv. oryzicola]UBB94699.1 hypothetical protein K2I41_10435 [Xanthomonas oryzae pv. oryzicola]ULX26093.1 hypothetical protein IYN96_09880 [Xanthomonas oryzae pv. oryzicola]
MHDVFVNGVLSMVPLDTRDTRHITMSEDAISMIDTSMVLSAPLEKVT